MLFLASVLSPSHAATPTFRWGVSGGLGYFVPIRVVDVSLEFRAGVQLSRHLGLFGQLEGIKGWGFGVVLGPGRIGIRSSSVSMYDLALMGEASAGPLFVAAGPLMGRGKWVRIYQYIGIDNDGPNGVGQGVLASSGWIPGVDLAVGLVGKKKQDGHRRGFRMAIDSKLMWAKTDTAQQQAGVDAEGGATVAASWRLGSTLMGFTTMLTFGYEFR